MRQAMFLLMCLFFAVSCSKTDLATPAQREVTTLANQSSNQDHEFAVSMIFNQFLSMKVFCGSTQVDVLSGQLTDQHCTMFGHYDAELGFVSLWMIHRFYGEMTSQSTGEIFKMDQTRKITPDIASFSVNLIGNLGTHYIASGTILRYSPFTWTMDKALCLETGAGN